MTTSASRELLRRAMYEESSLNRLRQRYPELDERGLQLKDLLDSFGVSGREALPKLRAWLDAGEDPDAVLALHGPTTKESLLTGALWRVLSFWRSDRDFAPHITTRKTTAPHYYW